MITHVAISRGSATIGAAAILVCLGLMVWLAGRRKGDRTVVPVLLFGFPGIYLGLVVMLDDAPKWLYIPSLLLVTLSALVQLIILHRQPADSSISPADTDDPV